MKTHSVELRAERADGFNGAITWRLMDFAELDAELTPIEKATGGATRTRPDAIEISEEAWERLMAAVIGHLPESGSVEWIAQLSSRDRQAVQARVSQARRALKEAARTEAAGARTTTALVPSERSSRLELLLGYGELPIAWVMRLDVARC